MRTRTIELPKKYLTLLFNSAKEFSSTLNLKDLLPKILENTKKILNCEAASVLLYDELSKELYFDVALGEKANELKEVRIPLGKGIAGKVAETLKSVIVNNVGNTTQHLKWVDLKTGFKTKSMIAVPLVFADRLLGVIEILNKRSGSGFFNSQDLKIIEALANVVAISIHNARTYENAITDPLTNLYNSGYVQRTITEILKSGVNTLIFAIIDIDYFKVYNDNNGHQAGNQAIKITAEVMRLTIREENSIYGRYGGEEFAIAFYDLPREKSIAIIEDVRRNIENTDYPGGKRQPLGKVTVSIGVSSYPDEGKNLESLVELADKRLYVAKKIGRNCVVFADN
ncbi:MAG TPA: hypothetical protein DHV62_04945 [Elusimicrobia bacterium]|jgi:diguanylate cyclase (GGDEF)-like protein|nr:hypothetical protein [Elusimicrobiota bacterium]